MTFAYDDPDEAMVEDVSGSLKEARYWMRGRSGFCYRLERLPDGSYGNEEFVTEFQAVTRVTPTTAQWSER